MKQLFILSFALLSLCSYGQKKSVIGFSFDITDFESPNQVQRTSFKDVWRGGDFTNSDRFNFGFSLLYWKALTRHLDVSGRYNGIFKSSNFTSDRDGLKDYFNELEGSFHLRAFSDNKVLNPFLTAGAGIGNYWTRSRVAGYAPLGIGLQFNLLQETYIFLQGNYRLSFDKKTLPNNLFYSFGITQSLHDPKPAKVDPIPAAVIEDNDRDKDGYPNSVDMCPDMSGTVNGCPDGDKDGIADKDDKCATVPGIQKYGGCPVPDTDNDGINDENDKCISIAGLARYQGCPIPDSDGVNDEEDKCPNVVGEATNNGCPVIKEEVIQKVNIAAKHINFVIGKDVLDKRSFAQLDNLATLLKSDEMLKLSVEGHTDNTGSDEKNQFLSEKRALAVKNYLVKKGIDESRINTVGYGSSKPVATNATAAGRAKNRRVEMTVTNY
jgi:OmpA-OmpF porin, OOP family